MLYTPIFSIHRDTSLKHLLQIFMNTNILETKSEVVKRRWCPVKSKKLRQLQLLHCERPVKGRMHNRRSVFCLFRWLWLPLDVCFFFFENLFFVGGVVEWDQIAKSRGACWMAVKMCAVDLRWWCGPSGVYVDPLPETRSEGSSSCWFLLMQLMPESVH